MKEEEDKTYWYAKRLEARARLNEIAPMREKLKELLKDYDRIFQRAYRKFAEADEHLAMRDGRFNRVEPTLPKPRKAVKAEDMSKDDLDKLIRQLEELRDGVSE